MNVRKLSPYTANQYSRGLRRQRRNAIVNSGPSFTNADAAFTGMAKGPALFAVPIEQKTAHSSFSKILCGYCKCGIAHASGVIIGLSIPDHLEVVSGARMISVSLEQVVVHAAADSGSAKVVSVFSPDDGASLFSFANDAFREAMLCVDAGLGYQLASNSNLRKLSGGVAEAAFSINIVSSSAASLEPSAVGLLATVLLAPGIFAFMQHSATGTWRAPDQVNHRLRAAQGLTSVHSVAQPRGRRIQDFSRTQTTAVRRDTLLALSSLALRLQAATFWTVRPCTIQSIT